MHAVPLSSGISVAATSHSCDMMSVRTNREEDKHGGSRHNPYAGLVLDHDDGRLAVANTGHHVSTAAGRFQQLSRMDEDMCLTVTGPQQPTTVAWRR